MCGISGVVTKDKNKKINSSKILNLMKSRGPNNQNFKILKSNFFKTYFFVSRLSILDLNIRSNQPQNYNGLTLIYNGEIYNYKEIREELKYHGFKFRTTSGGYNGSGDTHIFMAFAEQPFVNSKGVPCNAR